MMDISSPPLHRGKASDFQYDYLQERVGTSKPLPFILTIANLSTTARCNLSEQTIPAPATCEQPTYLLQLLLELLHTGGSTLALPLCHLERPQKCVRPQLRKLALQLLVARAQLRVLLQRSVQVQVLLCGLPTALIQLLQGKV
jgi:hypothetical protein